MNVKLIDLVPEFIAGTCLLPAGFYMGYVFHIYQFTDPKTLTSAQYWPYIISMVAAVITSIFFTLIRYFRRREVFYHLHCLTVGCVLFFIGGVVLWGSHHGPSAIYISSIGHGIVYISSLSYAHFRMSSVRRSFKISTLFIRYFVGCSWAAQAIVESTEVRAENIADDIFIGNPDTINEYAGMILTVMSIVCLALNGINELLQRYHVQHYNYKRSLDENVNNGKYFHSRKKAMDQLRTRQLLGFTAINTESRTLRFCRFIKRGSEYWMLLLKLSGTMLFSNAMIVLTGVAATLYHNDIYYYYFVQWTVLIGAIIGSVGLFYFSGKSIFQIGSIVRIILLITAISLLAKTDQISEVAIPMTVFYGFCGFSYFVADMAIMDMSDPKYLEIMLAFGYIIEMLPIAIMQYYHFYNTSLVVANTLQNTFAAYAVVFLIATIILMVISGIFQLNTRNKSLLQMRYDMWGITDITPATTPMPIAQQTDQRDTRQRPTAPLSEIHA